METYDLVHDLHAWRDDWKIGVKVLKRWYKADEYGKPGLAFVLVDEYGSRIYASCGNMSYSYFDMVCPEGQWVKLSKFRLIPADWERKERNTRHSSQMILNTETKVSSIRPLTEDPFEKFVDFDEINQRPYSHLYPIDLIGVLVNVGEILSSESTEGIFEKSLKFTIKDLEDRTLDCLAHGDFAVDIKNQTTGVDGPFAICVLTDWMIYKDQGPPGVKPPEPWWEEGWSRVKALVLDWACVGHPSVH
ncbi:uncharacterized protein LOC112085462 [Eutrema salsugineum]|uniref:uncharacterized protein LOC112085462 n=1 Tax=Eutrema salsugineum TaxID=72664 RepID=UPI000CED0169|nr:uncharacterized protein LOC112085462 [Eutrema salsugineum]